MSLVDFDKLFVKADNLRNDAKVDEAIHFYKEIAELATKPEELPHKARALHMAGVSAKESVLGLDSSYYRDANEYFSQAETAFKELGDLGGLGAVYRDRAILNDYAGNSEEASTWFQKSIAEFRQIDDPHGLGISLDKFGLHFAKQGDYETAKRYIREGLSILEREPEAGFFHTTALYDLARVEYKLENYAEAIQEAEAALSWYEADHGDHSYERRLAQLYGFLSVAYYQIGQSKKAQRAASKYKNLLKTFDPMAAKVIERDLEKVAN